jgi:simple sugar transport system ATP-binding protein
LTWRWTPPAKSTSCRWAKSKTVEILKVLYRGSRILILDEPTAVLTPQESTSSLHFAQMRDEGCAVNIITHKLNEVWPSPTG